MDTKDYLLRVISAKKRLTMQLVTCRQDILDAQRTDADILGLFHTACLNVPQIAGYLPIANANAVVLEASRQLDLGSCPLPVFAGVCGIEPIRLMGNYLHELHDIGFSGIMNFPPICILNGTFRSNLDALNFSTKRECRIFRLASRNAALLPLPFVRDAADGLAAAAAGAEFLVLHLGFCMHLQMDSYSVSSILNRVQDTVEKLHASYPSVRILIYQNARSEGGHPDGSLSKIAEGSGADGLFFIREPWPLREQE